MGIAKENVIKMAFCNLMFLFQKVQVQCFSQIVQTIPIQYLWGKIFLEIEKYRSCWILFPNNPSYPPPILPGALIGGFPDSFRDGISKFTGVGRCGDRISPVFGSVANVLVILWGCFGVWECVFQHTVSTHTCLPFLPSLLPLQWQCL